MEQNTKTAQTKDSPGFARNPDSVEAATQRDRHTPAPWRVCEETTDYGFGPALVIRQDDPVANNLPRIADCGRSAMSDGTIKHFHRTAIANARLIATAPRMADALNQARIWLGNNANSDEGQELMDFIATVLDEAGCSYEL